MRYTLQALLVVCGIVGGLFALGSAMDLRSAVQEIEMLIGILIIAVVLGALLVSGTGEKKAGGYVQPQYPPPPGHQ